MQLQTKFRCRSTLLLFLAGMLFNLPVRCCAAEDQILTVSVIDSRPAAAPTLYRESLAAELPFHPEVDLQERNQAGAQGDVSIRGGSFENSGVAVGAASFFDPQTGHYLTELPVPQDFLSPVAVQTGLENGLRGANAAVGTLSYNWSPINTISRLRAGLGDFGTNSQDGLLALSNLSETDFGALSAAVSAARIESGATLPGSYYDLERFAARLQLQRDAAQTDLFFGYQNKRFAWPDLYAPQSVHTATRTSGIESEDLSTNLAVINHRRESAQSSLEAGAFFRRNRDDYEFDRYQPGLYNPYRHRTDLSGAMVAGEERGAPWRLKYSAKVLYDQLSSSALTFGPYSSRGYQEAALIPGWDYEFSPSRRLRLLAGVSFFDSNRSSSAMDPLMRAEVELLNAAGSEQLLYLEYSGKAQVPSYTALNSNPASGLFRGNPDLGLQRSRNLELGYQNRSAPWHFQTAAFYRRDNSFVDWVYDSSLGAAAARSAASVDLRTLGNTTQLSFNPGDFTASLGYGYLDTNAEYPGVSGDSSFYALNYPRHRLVTSLALKPLAEIRLFIDYELRRQRANALRAGGATAALGSCGLTWSPSRLPRWTISASIDNLWNEQFEEVPGAPGKKRQALLQIAWQLK